MEVPNWLFTEFVGVLPAFLSRVSNATVFKKAGVLPLSEQLLERQLQLFGRVALSPASDPRRLDTFAPEAGSITPQIGRFVRRVGRPRQDWTNQLLEEGRKRMGCQTLQRLLSDTTPGAEQRWKKEVRRTFSSNV